MHALRFILFLLAPLAFAKPVVVSTTTMLDDFVRTLGGDSVETVCLLTPGRDPHTYDPTPADVRRIARADLVIINGLGFETWADKLVRHSGFRGRLIVAAEKVRPISACSADHDHSAHDHDHGEFDPHAWHDLRNASLYIETIRDALVALLPAEAATIRSRAVAYQDALIQLDQEYRDTLGSIPEAQRRIVTSHDSLRYLGQAYGLKIIPIAGLRPDQEPGARQLATIVTQIKAENIRAVLIESTTNPKIPALLAKEAGVPVVSEFYTDSLGAADTPGATFLGMARSNLATLVRILR